jgi:hypothetical protein
MAFQLQQHLTAASQDYLPFFGRPDYPPPNAYRACHHIAFPNLLPSLPLDMAVRLFGGNSQSQGKIQQDMLRSHARIGNHICGSYFLSLTRSNPTGNG